MSSRRRRARRLTRTLLGVLLAVGLIHAMTAHGDDDNERSTGASAPTVHTPPGLFAEQLIVEGIHGFNAAEVTQIGRAVDAAPLTITDGEVYVVHGSGTYDELPLATMVADPAGYGRSVGSTALATSLSRGVVLAQTTARLFDLHVGQLLRVHGGKPLRVAAVVDDRVVGGYQMAAGRDAPAGLGSHADYVIVRVPGGQLASREAAIQHSLPSRRLRFTLPSSGAYFSPNGDVLTQNQLDQQFGVFHVRHTSTGIRLDPRWISAYITERRIVQLGNVICARRVMGPLTAAMREITNRGLGKTINTADFIAEGGCWNPRTVRFGHGMISHHAWGAAIDINVGRNPLGAAPRQDPRLVAVMAKYGFTWGGNWLRHDGAHYEWVGQGETAR